MILKEESDVVDAVLQHGDPLDTGPKGETRVIVRIGFTHAVIPRANAPKQAPAGLEVVAVTRIEEAIAALRGLEQKQ